VSTAHSSSCRDLAPRGERYHQAFLASSDAIILSDANSGFIEDANPAACALYGYDDHEFRALVIDDLCAPAHGTADSEVVMLLQRHVRKDGTTFPVDVSVGHFASEGHPVAMLVVRELTERLRVDQLRSRFVEKVISAEESERRRIARELHDETGQRLTALLAGLKLVERQLGEESARQRICELRVMTETTLDEITRLSRGLHPSVLSTLGFAAALDQYAGEYRRLHGIGVDLQIAGFEGFERLPDAIEIALYRILQEALTNVVKHAGARRVSLRVRRTSGEVTLVVADDGHGFVPDARAAASAGGLGLVGIRERVALLRGSAAVESRPGGGTTIRVSVPAPEARKDARVG
jgi:PAS domain S-box-containing protein